MKITLRGQEYDAEYLTDLNYLAIANLFVEENGRFVLEKVQDFKELSQPEQIKLTRPLMTRLTDPDIKAQVAQSLSAIAPSLPQDLVSYGGKGNFRLNLELKELLEIAIALGNELNPVQKTKDNEIAKLQEQIKQLQQHQTIDSSRL